MPPGQVSGVCTVGLGQWWAVVMLIPLVAAWALVLTSPAAAVNAFDLSTAVDRHQAVAQSPDA